MLENDKPRRVIPRWRNSSLIATTAEARARSEGATVDYRIELVDKKLEFENNNDIPTASEFMFLTFEAGDKSSSERAAKFILERESTIGSTALTAAAKVIASGRTNFERSDNETNFLKDARRRLRIDFRNPVLLVDLSLGLVKNGHDESARRYVMAASAMAPQSRFVTRSTARYLLHVDDKDRAHEILKKNPAISKDPWIQASEIAVATVCGRTSKYTKRSIQYLMEQKFIGPELSELASAVATVELLYGSEKKAKRLFQKSLLNPNDNSLAQAESVAQRLKLVVDDNTLQTPLSFEANSSHAYRRLLIPESIAFANNWSEDEPFSSRPWTALAFLHSLEENFPLAYQASKKAIKNEANYSVPLQLNLMFSLIQQGNLEGIKEDLLRIISKPDSKSYATHILANIGAYAYACGEHNMGRFFYERAIKAARAKNNAQDEALAHAFFARAAFISNDPISENLVGQTAKTVSRLPSPGAIYVIQRLVNSDKSDSLREIANNRVAKKKWEWNSVTNTLTILE